MKSKIVSKPGCEDNADQTFGVPHLEEAFPNVARDRLERALKRVLSRWGLQSPQCDILEGSGIPSEGHVLSKDE